MTSKLKGLNTYLLILFIFVIIRLNTYSQVQNMNEVILPVPHVADRGNTWATACTTMLLKFYKPDISLDEVVRQGGYPPIINYTAIDLWLKLNHSLRLNLEENRTMDDIIESIHKKNPVMILQQASLGSRIATNRIVAGYNTANKEFIITDPANQGKFYRIKTNIFQKLWDNMPRICPGWPKRFFWVITPRILPGDFLLSVPFEPNHGQTCASSSMTMLLKFNKVPINFKDVLMRSGLPPIINYQKVNDWIRGNFKLKLVQFNNRNIQDIITCVKAGYPVMVLQQFKMNHAEGHNRVVVGYNTKRREFILNDPSDIGFEYRMNFDVFQKLWDKLPEVCPGWPPRFFWIILPLDKTPPINS